MYFTDCANKLYSTFFGGMDRPAGLRGGGGGWSSPAPPARVCLFGFLRSGEIIVPSEGGYGEGAHLSLMCKPQHCQNETQGLPRVRVGVDIF